ncbi:adenylate/guanylate cyclase domain-containing protein [Bradyrhizobium barranii subsp. barranii]|uniref:Adenylate/guanylate cyclase domain-containing protein n=1 Tax=Bradyrhizobium barranii subsp. barranii TaxID=2823807 RepID=A0A7Z0QC06_9BRAD|nr:adenylate/guanylate cyclase domain-containing protein [Bradyrhizobium barranii]UGX92937.1 adenylate/guanylate cyclase domain-containing protein [Bradyrhizobium barranii subsp. barranii]
MALEDLGEELSEEVSAIMGTGFSISITSTNLVPRADDPSITFPNLDTLTQGAKLITTCVLYIDMRKSTDLSFAHRPQTVAKLYTAFVRAMTRTARHFGGHVRGIIGDRVMVLFDSQDCFKNAVHCAIAMNTVSQHIINKHFKANEVRFGIGIDHGRMLVTKAGIRRHGEEQSNYRNLVWLGRPANVASKLTDAANKPAEHITVPMVRVAYDKPPQPTLGGLLGLMPGALNSGTNLGNLSGNPLSPMGGLFGSGLGALSSGSGLANALTSPLVSPTNSASAEPWTWVNETPLAFLSKIDVKYAPSRLSHQRPDFGSFYLIDEEQTTREATPAILMTGAVWSGFKKALPNSNSVQGSLFTKVAVEVPGYSADVFGGNVVYPSLKPP